MVNSVAERPLSGRPDPTRKRTGPGHPPRPNPPGEIDLRIVSLLPSATEILDLIGASDRLVGRSHECDTPASVAGLPAVTRATAGSHPGATLDPGEAAAINHAVKQAAAQGQTLFELDEPLLRELNPDLIITQDVCAVCAVDHAAVERVASDLPGKPAVLSLKPETVEGVLDDILSIGGAVGMEREAMHAVVNLRERADRALEHVNPYTEGPVVGFMEWTDPIYVAGHWSVQLIERAGGRHPLNETVAKPGSGAAVGPQQAERIAGKSIAVSSNVFAAVKPDALVIAPCGLTLDQARAETDRLMTHGWFRELPAVQAGKVAIVDGNQMFNRPGPRLWDALEFLVGYLNDRPALIPADFPVSYLTGP